MYIFSLAVLVSSVPLAAIAQTASTPKDTVAMREQVGEANCALFPAVAQLPAWIPEKKLAPSRRFTPTASQAAAAEQALAVVQLLNVNLAPKTRRDSTYAQSITQQLGQYHRQYFGFYNRRKQPCLFINLIGDVAFSAEDIGLRPTPLGYVPQWLRTYLFIGDGGADHWSIYYNLATGKFYQYWHSLDLGGG